MSEQTVPAIARAWHLDSRPEGWPQPSGFSLREVELPAPGPGQLLVANEYLSVDPYMRGRMSDKKSYIEPYEVGAPMDGPAVGLYEKPSTAISAPLYLPRNSRHSQWSGWMSSTPPTPSSGSGKRLYFTEQSWKTTVKRFASRSCPGVR